MVLLPITSALYAWESTKLCGSALFDLSDVSRNDSISCFLNFFNFLRSLPFLILLKVPLIHSQRSKLISIQPISSFIIQPTLTLIPFRFAKVREPLILLPSSLALTSKSQKMSLLPQSNPPFIQTHYLTVSHSTLSLGSCLKNKTPGFAR